MLIWCLIHLPAPLSQVRLDDLALVFYEHLYEAAQGRVGGGAGG